MSNVDAFFSLPHVYWGVCGGWRMEGGHLILMTDYTKSYVGVLLLSFFWGFIHHHVLCHRRIQNMGVGHRPSQHTAHALHSATPLPLLPYYYYHCILCQEGCVLMKHHHYHHLHQHPSPRSLPLATQLNALLLLSTPQGLRILWKVLNLIIFIRQPGQHGCVVWLSKFEILGLMSR